ncbi:hypothetical protein A3Q56_07562 [Intoshia linei]|uniref:Zinc transporter ZIP13 n=1 Tax=Intoshia linei TaxID=1819745 RepID=A0A177AU24_9BILA|nr:hypothetical protein A3Q56_07562 [Intoshia linei]
MINVKNIIVLLFIGNALSKDIEKSAEKLSIHDIKMCQKIESEDEDKIQQLNDTLNVTNVALKTNEDRLFDYYSKELEQLQIVSDKANKKSEESSLAWLYSFISVMVIGLITIPGALLVIFKDKPIFSKIVGFFMALAIGVLMGDVTLHLIPDLFSNANNDEKTLPFQIIGLMILIGVYVMFQIEQFLHSLIKAKPQSKYDPLDETSSIQKVKSENVSDGTVNYRFGIHPMVWTIQIGDAFSNLIDGMAIGIAYRRNTYFGISISLSMLCHEIPHELGQYAIMIENIKRNKPWLCAIGLHMMSVTTSVIGVIISFTIPTSPDTKDIIMAMTAGFFIYLSMTDLVIIV